jgi:hypothetical protein
MQILIAACLFLLGSSPLALAYPLYPTCGFEICKNADIAAEEATKFYIGQGHGGGGAGTAPPPEEDPSCDVGLYYHIYDDEGCV